MAARYKGGGDLKRQYPFLDRYMCLPADSKSHQDVEDEDKKGKSWFVTGNTFDVLILYIQTVGLYIYIHTVAW